MVGGDFVLLSVFLGGNGGGGVYDEDGGKIVGVVFGLWGMGCCG